MRRTSKILSLQLLIAFVALTLFQSIMTTVVLGTGGFFEETRVNQYKIFSEKVNSRKNTLENQIWNVWTGFDGYTASVERRIVNMKKSEMSPDAMLADLSPTLVNILYHTRTTGVFLAFPDGMESGELDAIYLRNYNPERRDPGSGSVFMQVGPWSVVEKLDTHTMVDWSYRLKLTEENEAFIRVPFDTAGVLGRSEWLGYWSKPFRLNPNGEEIITYSVPIFDENDNVSAILGVEISLQYLYEFLPASELQKANSYGYAIGIRSGTDEMHSSITYGALQKRILEPEGLMELEPVSDDYDIFLLDTEEGKEEIYDCVKKMGIYYHNTPFEAEEWYLIGLMQKEDLLAFPDELRKTLFYCFAISALLSLAVSAVLSQWFTRNSRLMELAGVPVGVVEMEDHSDRIHMTGGVSRLLNLSKAQERAFVTDKYKFLAHVTELFQKGQEEEDVFRTEFDGKMYWIRMSRQRGNALWRYIFEDVTDEMIRTRALQRERDVDGLTGVGNRMAFKNVLEKMNEQTAENHPLAIVMCDLNDLKYVNDHFGHDSGDEYIREAACKIQGAFPDSTVYRIGGDEFAVIAENMTPAQIQSSLERLERRMNDYSQSSPYKAFIAAGFAVYDPAEDGRLEDTLSRADRKMYQKKREMKQEKRKNT